MKRNLPVTQVAIDYSEGEVFITRTDTRGIITYANESFVKISGFSKDELVGTSHNIVRHPDMPEWAFKDLWDTVKSGLPWRGIVKNRAKNGNHYWVKATVSPIIQEGAVIGYLSLRKKPSRQEIDAAETAYRRPPVHKLSLGQRFRNLPLQFKLQLLIQPFLLVVLVAAQIVMSRQMEQQMLDSVKMRATGIAMEVIDSANMLMITGNISNADDRKLLIEKIAASGNISKLQLVRSKLVSDQYGAGLPEEQPGDPAVQAVIASKTASYGVEQIDGKPTFRAITPYFAVKNFHGTDCLSCHLVPEGSVNGASDLHIDLSSDYATYNRLQLSLIAGQILIQVVLFFFIGWAVSRFVVRPTQQVEKHLQALVAGDLSAQMDISGRDEMGRILCNVQSSKVLLGAMIDQIATTSERLKDKSNTLANVVMRVASNSEAQSTSAMQAASAMEDAAVSANEISDHAKKASASAQASFSNAEGGRSKMHESVTASRNVVEAVQGSSRAIAKLEDAVNKINGITGVIREVADQTNLLALNAAIEAARAGEQGRGFAVVADEVRKLAEKTQRSTADIASRVKDITLITQETVSQMELATQGVESNMERLESGATLLEDIALKAQKTMEMARNIADSVHGQAAASSEIAHNVQHISSITHENADASREAAMAAQDLDSTAFELNKLTQQFKI
ncbi:MAG: PAS domain-containing protein [Nitrosomonadales bacterium]|nr:PAS domain-containing protein [Nitrosomonadales bacterium]